MSALRAEGHDLGRLLACSGLARSTYYYALSHPAKPTRPELREAVAEIFMRTANGCGHRQVAMCLRAELGARVADKTVLKIMREMGIRCGIRRETDYHRYNSYRGVVGETFENIVGRDFSADGPWRKMGTDVTEFKQPWGKAYFAPVDVRQPRHGAAGGPARPAAGEDAGGREARAALGHGLAVPACRLVRAAEGCRDRPEHVQEGQLHRQRRHRAGLRPHQRRVLPRKDMARLRVVQLKGLTPEEFRSQSLVA